MTLHSTLTARLTGLLPPERRPHPDNPMADLIGTLGHVEVDSVQAAFRMIYLWLASNTDEAGLTLLAHSRYLQRFPGEPLEIFRQRVMGAFDFWEKAGTLPGVKLALAQAGYRAIIIEHFHEGRAHWAEFSVVLGPAQPLKTDAYWDGQTEWGGDALWGFRLPAVPLNSLIALIREVKPAHTRLRRLIWSPQGRYWGGGMTWGEGREPPPPQLGWGIYTGIQGYVPAPERTDSGPAWGESDNEVLYEYEGAPDTYA